MTDYMLPNQPSLGSATGTRVDSACKHHHQCRVSTDDLLRMTLPANNAVELQKNKFRYCAHKDELAVSVGRPWAADTVRKTMNNAYPRVITNIGMLDGKDEKSIVFRKMLTYMYHYCRSLDEKKLIVDWFKTKAHRPQHPNGENIDYDEKDHYFRYGAIGLEEDTEKWLHVLHDYHPMGYCQTVGWAHANTGDTMTTVMIGGLRTVMNGDFEVFTGDIIQWYWPFELDCFHADGKRKKFPEAFYPDNTCCNIDPTLEWYLEEENGRLNVKHTPSKIHLEASAKDREKMQDRSYGLRNGEMKMVPRIKPYFVDEVNPRMFDRMRVFAVAIGCARPHEFVDIKICRQAL